MPDVGPPVFVALGKRKRKACDAVENGDGPLVAEVKETLLEVETQLGDRAKGKKLVPVVVLYKKKRRKGAFSF